MGRLESEFLRGDYLETHTVQHIQRIVMEVFSSVIQHAKVSQVMLSARYVTTPSCIEMCIHDNGIGFDAGAQRTVGQGLANLQFRAQAMGADLTFEAPSRVVLRLPC